MRDFGLSPGVPAVTGNAEWAHSVRLPVLFRPGCSGEGKHCGTCRICAVLGSLIQLLPQENTIGAWLILPCWSLPLSSFVHWCQFFFFSSLKQTNGYDAEFYGPQSLNRRSGRVSTVNLHATKFTQIAEKLLLKYCSILLLCIFSAL